MWTMFVLLCGVNGCVALGGPQHATEEACVADFMDRGVPYVRMNFPHLEVRDFICYEWGEGA